MGDNAAGPDASQSTPAPGSPVQQSSQRAQTPSPEQAGQGSPEQGSPGQGVPGGDASQTQQTAAHVEVDDVSCLP